MKFLNESSLELLQSAAVQCSVLDALPGCVALLDAQGVVVAVNEAWHLFAGGCGALAGSAVGSDYLDACAAFDVAAPESAGEAATFVRGVLAGERPEAEFVYHCADADAARERWFRLHLTRLDAGADHGTLVMHFDVTESVQAEQRLFELAHFDSLTGLPNRLLFLDRLRHTLFRAKRYANRLAVLFVDLDRFKNINDTLGHHVGDELLKEVARRLRGCLRESDAVGRLGGDEFAVLLPELEDLKSAEAVARKIVASLSQVFRWEGQELFCGASVGIALYPDDADDPDRLMQYADTAMYLAKEAGRNTWRFYTPAMNERALAQLRLDGDLRQALARGEFALYYQPKVDCRSGQVVGVEALLRWNHPLRGLVGPVDFVPMLEETGLIIEVGEWVLRTACRQVVAWSHEGLPPVTVAVNLSARQLRDGQLISVVGRILGDSGLPPQLLELELTESALMVNPDQVAATLAELRRLGVRISVDDFGTGYSSLAYLKRFPLDAVKVDRSFVQDIAADPDDASITRAVITMAHNLKLKVVAEGVENEGQLALLMSNHCDEIQGYFFSRPLPADETAELLASRRALAKPAEPSARRQRTLLLVDDEENILSALKRLLRRDGYHILAASSGLAALELLASNPVDVILSDQRMPQMTGVEFLRRARTIHPDTVRMVLSGYTELQSITDAINEGAIYKFLTKPWDDELLRANIEEAFRHKELGDENRRLADEVHNANRELAGANTQLRALIEDKQRQLLRDEASLDIARSILQEVPMPVVGVDDDGLIVFANAAAENLWPGPCPLLTADAAERLPAPLLEQLAVPEDSECELECGGRRRRFACRQMHGRSHGRLLVALD